MESYAKEDERLWADYFADPSIANRNRLAEHYLPLTLIAARLVHRTEHVSLRQVVAIDDLAVAAQMALLEAIPRYRPAVAKFATFVWYRLVGAARDEVRAMTWGRRAAGKRRVYLYTDVRRKQLANQRSRIGLGEMPEENWRALSDVDARDPGDVLADAEQALIELNTLHATVRRLPARQREVIELNDLGDTTLRALGERHGITESRMCQIRREALNRLREDMFNGLDGVL